MFFFLSHCISFSYQKLIKASKHYQYFWQKYLHFQTDKFSWWFIDRSPNEFIFRSSLLHWPNFFLSQFLLLIFNEYYSFWVYILFWITAPKNKVNKWVNQYCQIAVQQFLAYQTTKSCTNYNTTSKKKNKYTFDELLNGI